MTVEQNINRMIGIANEKLDTMSSKLDAIDTKVLKIVEILEIVNKDTLEADASYQFMTQ